MNKQTIAAFEKLAVLYETSSNDVSRDDNAIFYTTKEGDTSKTMYVKVSEANGSILEVLKNFQEGWTVTALWDYKDELQWIDFIGINEKSFQQAA